MINIGGVTVIPKDAFTVDRNKLEERDSGFLSTFNTRSERFEPYDLAIVEGIDEQFVVQADNVIRLRNGLFEHQITLVEAIATFDGFYPADRIFSSDPPKTLGQVLTVYKTELEKYHNLSITFDTEADWTNTIIRQKEFVGVNFGVIVADLFRTLDAKPRARLVDGEWEIFPDFYNERNNLITPNPVSDLLVQDNLDYATKVKTQIKNGIYEGQEERFFPSEIGSIFPKSDQPQIADSRLEYQLDSGIIEVTRGLVVDVEIRLTTGGSPPFIDFNVDLDISEHIVPKPIWDGLPTPASQFASGFHKKNSLFYDIGGRSIKNLFVFGTEQLFFFFDNNNQILENAIKQTLIRENILIPGQTFTSNTFPATSYSIRTNLRDIKMRFKYIPQRSLDVVHHRQYIKNMNEITQIHNQRDSQTEVERYKNVLKNLSNRMGNDIKQFSQVFPDGNTFDLGDYDINDNVVVRVKNTYYNDYVLCEFMMAEGFGNIDGEAALWKEPSPFEILGKDIRTNLIIEEFVEVSRVSKDVSTRLLPNAIKSVLATFDKTIDTEPPVRAAVMRPITTTGATEASASGLYLPAFTGGGGNTTSFHFQIDDQVSAGRAFSSTLPDARFGLDLIYTEPDTSPRFGELDDFFFFLIPDVDFDDDGFYPLIGTGRYNGIAGQSLSAANIVDTINKDKNAKFAITYQQHFITDDPDIIIGTAVAKYNRLFTDKTIPNVQIYRSSKPYSIFDNKIRPNDVLVTGSVSVNDETRKLSLTALVPIGQPELKYVALAYNNEILLAFNDFVAGDEFFINFTDAAQRDIINQLPTPSSFGSQSFPDRLRFALTNQSTEAVTIEATLGGTTLTQAVQANDGDPLNIAAYSHTFEFTGLDPNTPYQLSFRALPSVGSDFVASSFGIANATTLILPTDPPVAVEKEVLTDPTVAVYTVTNPNDFAVQLKIRIDGFESNSEVFAANETRDVGAVLIAAQEGIETGVEYDIDFRFITTQFVNNWFSDYTAVRTLFIGQLDAPTYNHSLSGSTSGVNTLTTFFNWFNPNNAATQINVKLYETAAPFQAPQFLRGETTVSVGANAGVTVSFTGNFTAEAGFSTSAVLLSSGFSGESNLATSSPNVLTPKYTTGTPELTINTNQIVNDVPSVSFNIKNTDAATATVYISRNPNPDASNNEASLSIGAGLTEVRTYQQLFGANIGEGVNETIFARAIATNKLISQQGDLNFTAASRPPTASPTLTITDVGETTVTFDMRNNDSETAILTWGVSTPLSNNASVPAGNTITRTLSNLTRGFNYLLQVNAQATNKAVSTPNVTAAFKTQNALADVWELVGVQQVGQSALTFDETLAGTPSPIPTTCPINEQEALTLLNTQIPATTRQIGHIVRVTRIATSPLRSCPTYYFAAVGVNKHDVRVRLITSIGNVTADFTIGNTSGSIGLTPSYQTIATQVSNGVVFSINVPVSVTFDNKDYTFLRWKVNGNDRPDFQNQISGSVVTAIDLEAEYEEVGLL